MVSLSGLREVETIQKNGKRKRTPSRIKAKRENQGKEEGVGFML
jgi:hypothetical protein